MTRSLRRSRRAPKRNSDYNVGDVVQVPKAGVILEGRLAQFLSEGTSPNPRWLVKFDGQPYKDEEMYEKAFGKLISAAEEEEDAGDFSPASQKRGSSRAGGSSKGSGTSSEEGEAGEEPAKEAKPFSSSSSSSRKSAPVAEGSNTGSDTSSNVETSRGGKSSRGKSAREERSKRRQAKIDEETVIIGEAPGVKRRVPMQSNHATKRHRGEADGEVVKVKLLTGTLYLYRGTQRRAEFIRRV